MKPVKQILSAQSFTSLIPISLKVYFHIAVMIVCISVVCSSVVSISISGVDQRDSRYQGWASCSYSVCCHPHHTGSHICKYHTLKDVHILLSLDHDLHIVFVSVCVLKLWSSNESYHDKATYVIIATYSDRMQLSIDLSNLILL